MEVKTVNILGVRLAAVNIKKVVNIIDSWIKSSTPAYICVTNVHSIVTSLSDIQLKKALGSANMCVPDGMPTVWVGRYYGHKKMRRVYGPDLMLEILKTSVEKGYKHFFYGGREHIVEELRNRMTSQFPGLNIGGVIAPPFRAATEYEEEELRKSLDKVAPDILWVGLGCPKQEKWMAEHVGKLNVKVMIGVGAAFDFHAGALRQAPAWMQRLGLEWAFRLSVEPKRLWKRYLHTVPLFILLSSAQIAGLKKYS